MLAATLLFMSSKLKDVNFPNLRMIDVENPERLMDLEIECEGHLLKKIVLYIKKSFCTKKLSKKCCCFFENTILEIAVKSMAVR